MRYPDLLTIHYPQNGRLGIKLYAMFALAANRAKTGLSSQTKPDDETHSNIPKGNVVKTILWIEEVDTLLGVLNVCDFVEI